MTDSLVYIPFPRDLYRDIIRMSDGRISPEGLAVSQVESWIAASVEFGFEEDWGDRLDDVAEKYAPHVYERWKKEYAGASSSARAEAKPLVWKEITVSAGSDVRMSYGNDQHYAKISAGKIVENGEEFTPSEWASKVAGGTSRNAWRDLWFRELGTKTWVPAQLLRSQARGESE